MSEIIPPMPVTGERFIPTSMTGITECEHLHRYYGACKLIPGGLDVLDIASGEGYGSSLLAQTAKSVVGVDICPDTIAYASKKYTQSNIRFLQGSCASIPLANASIDVVVSFETLEHHAQHEEMMAEIKRVLRPSGFLIISTPDKNETVYAAGSIVPNHYHVKELYRDEFETLLSTWFKSHHIYGQRVYFGSYIAPACDQIETPNSLTNFSLLDNNTVVSDQLPAPIYFIAIASDSELPRFPVGLFYGKDQDVYALHVALSAAYDENARLRQSPTISQQAVIELQNKTVAQEAMIEQLQAVINNIHTSRSWKISKPLRFINAMAKKIIA